MNDKSLIKSVLINSFLILALMVSGWFAYYSYQNSASGSHPTQRTTPDSFMNEVYFTHYNSQGKVESSFYTPHLTHYPAHDLSLLEKPRLVSEGEDNLRWVITADHGTAQNNGSLIYLNDNVQIQRLDNSTHKVTTLTTTAMTFYPKRKYLETKQPVTIVDLNSKMTSIGFSANLITGDISFLSNTQSVYVQSPASESNR